jgi:hypothetical protein
VRSVTDTYFGWSELRHEAGCKRPNWEIDTRTDHEVWRPRTRGSDVDHRCADDECGHGQRWDPTTIRIVCRSCGQAHIITTEQRVVPTDTNFLGFGQAPRKVAGLLLWPGEPLTTFGMSVRDGLHVPYQLLVTGPGVTRPVREDLLGEITQTLTRRGAVRYGAVAGLSPEGEFGFGEFRWEAAAEHLRSIPAAVKWIAAHVHDRDRARADLAAAEGIVPEAATEVPR